MSTVQPSNSLTSVIAADAAAAQSTADTAITNAAAALAAANEADDTADAAQSTANAALVKSANLSDLTNAATARSNLGAAKGATETTTVGATLVLPEGTNNGVHKVTFQAPASLTGDRVVTIPDSDVTLGAGGLSYAAVLFDLAGQSIGSTYLARSRALQLAPRRTYARTRSYAISEGAEFGSTKLNFALVANTLVSVDANTTTAGAVHFVAGTATSDWFGATFTNPFLYQSFVWGGERCEFIFRAYSNGDGANYEQCGFLLTQAGTSSKYCKIGVGSAGATPRLHGVVNDGTLGSITTITTDQRNAGVWVRVVLGQDGRVHASYVLTDTSTIPAGADWVILGTLAGTFTVGSTLRFGAMCQNSNASSGLTGGLKAMAVDIPIDAVVGRQALFDAETYDTAPSEQRIGVCRIGTTATIDLTKFKLALAAAENTLFGDSATITWSLVRGTDGQASATFAAAASVTVEGSASGEYANLYAKITSSGTSIGSIAVPIAMMLAA